jgi:hypothetical protein
VVNVTISVDEDTLRRARIRALERHESVNGYLAEMLRRYAGEREQGSVFTELARIADDAGSGVQGQRRQWTRDDLHRG